MRKGNARERDSPIRPSIRSVMLSWRSSNVDEMVWVAFAMEVSLPSKEKGHWKVPSVVGLAVIRCSLPSTAGAPCSGVVVRVAADDDGVVPGRPGGGAVVRVAADDDGVVPGRPGGGAVVRVAVDDDGVVPGRPGGGTVVRVAVDDDGVVPGCPGGGAPQSPVWCSTL